MRGAGTSVYFTTSERKAGKEWLFCISGMPQAGMREMHTEEKYLVRFHDFSNIQQSGLFQTLLL